LESATAFFYFFFFRRWSRGVHAFRFLVLRQLRPGEEEILHGHCQQIGLEITLKGRCDDVTADRCQLGMLLVHDEFDELVEQQGLDEAERFGVGKIELVRRYPTLPGLDERE
jgi:hypothetical protein